MMNPTHTIASPNNNNAIGPSTPAKAIIKIVVTTAITNRIAIKNMSYISSFPIIGSAEYAEQKKRGLVRTSPL